MFAFKSAFRVFRLSSSPIFADVPNRAERHISRFPFKLPIMGTRMNSSSTLKKTVQRARCSRSSPVKIIPTRFRSNAGVACDLARVMVAVKALAYFE
jgi:hypothetical protein